MDTRIEAGELHYQVDSESVSQVGEPQQVLLDVMYDKLYSSHGPLAAPRISRSLHVLLRSAILPYSITY